MVKTTTPAMDAELDGAATTLAQLQQIVRTDGVEFFFTTHDRDIVFNGDTYTAKTGLKSSAIANDSSLSVDNQEVEGIFDSADITEADLRAGLFDHAVVFLSNLTYEDISAGIVKVRRGRLGEVIQTEQGFFRVEIRGLTQAYSQRIVELYSPHCRADLGDSRCKTPIDPPLRSSHLELALGDFLKVKTNPVPSGFGQYALILPFDGADGDTTTKDFSLFENLATFQDNAQIDIAQSKFGGSSLLLDGVNDFVDFPDSDLWSFGAGAFTVEWWQRPTVVTGARSLVGQWDSAGNNLSWVLQWNGVALRLFWSTTGANNFNISNTSTITAAGPFFHIAVTRDAVGDVRMFQDGVQFGSTQSVTDTFFAANSILRIGGLASGIQDWQGHVDDLRITPGIALYTSNFTPPGVLPTVDPDASLLLLQEAFENRIYVCTTAGRTAALQPVYDETVGNLTTDGTAVLQAEEAWMRHVQVLSVTDPRREFVVTELTPNTGGPRAGGGLLGYPDDYMNFGAVVWETGDNADAIVGRTTGRTAEIKDFVADDGITIEQTIRLYLPLSFDVQVGDKARVYPGCDKRFETCIAKFDNALNFRGEPHVPGIDFLVAFPDAR